jgi:hypothetical protein
MRYRSGSVATKNKWGWCLNLPTSPIVLQPNRSVERPDREAGLKNMIAIASGLRFRLHRNERKRPGADTSVLALFVVAVLLAEPISLGASPCFTSWPLLTITPRQYRSQWVAVLKQTNGN